MQILGVALLLLALEAWNVATGGLAGAGFLLLQLAAAFVVLLVVARLSQRSRLSLVTLGAGLTAAASGGYVALVLSGHSVVDNPHGVREICGLLTGSAAGCLIPLKLRRRY